MSEAESPIDPSLPAEGADSGAALDEARAYEILRQVIDPELHYNIVDLGLIYNVVVDGKAVHVDMTLTTPGCPYGPMLMHDVKETLVHGGAEDVVLEIVWDPPWSPEKMSEEARLEFGFDL